MRAFPASYGRHLLILALAFLLASHGCAHRALVTDEIPPELYEFPRKLSDEVHARNPAFIVYGDHRPGWRIYERFLARWNWAAGKWLAFPVHIPLLAFNGVYGGVNFLRRVPDYGEKERNLVLRSIYDEVLTGNIDFVAHTGDIVENGAYASQWKEFLEETAVAVPLLKSVPYYPAPGNHDHPVDPLFGKDNYEAVFPDSRFYVKKFKDVILIFLDSSIILDQEDHIAPDAVQDSLIGAWFVSPPGSDEPSWLENELRASSEKYKIVVMHHPLFSFGKHAGDWQNTGWASNPERIRKRLVDLFKKYGVNAVFAGHEHYYEHNILRYEREGASQEMHFIITGGGGTPIRPLMPESWVNRYLQLAADEGFDVEMVERTEAYNYCIAKVSENGIEIEVKAVPTEKPYLPLTIEKFTVP